MIGSVLTENAKESEEMGVYIKNVTAKEMNELFDEHVIWWIEPDDIIDIEEAQPDMQSVTADRKTENSSEIPNNFAKDMNVRSKGEPQTDSMRGFLQGLHDAVEEIVDEPQTERSE